MAPRLVALTGDEHHGTGPGGQWRGRPDQVISQVVLSFGIPFALVPLIRLTSDPVLMGSDTNHRLTSVLGWSVAAIITILNVVLIYLTLTR